MAGTEAGFSDDDDSAGYMLQEIRGMRAKLQTMPSGALIRSIIREELAGGHGEFKGSGAACSSSAAPGKTTVSNIWANDSSASSPEPRIPSLSDLALQATTGEPDSPKSSPSRMMPTPTPPQGSKHDVAHNDVVDPVVPQVAPSTSLISKDIQGPRLSAGMLAIQKSKEQPLQRRMFRSPAAAQFIANSSRLSWHGLSSMPSFREQVRRLVSSAVFDYISASAVIVNSITMGMQTDHMARGLLESPSTAYRIVDLMFCIIFTLELTLRLVGNGKAFFVSADWKWNVFDLVLVTMQLLDEVLTLIADQMKSGDKRTGMNFSFLRILRILRLIKIMRVIRILRLVAELRTIVSSILGSMKSLLWTVILLFLLVYIFAVFLTQQVLDYRVGRLGEAEAVFDVQLTYYCGSLARSIFSLYQAISGGLDWDDLANPLMEQISVLLGFALVCYTAFSLLALMNVVTGVFVEAALESAKKDRSAYMLRHTRELFTRADPENTGVLDWDRFEASLDGEYMKDFFTTIDIDPSEAQSIFSLLDVDDSGTIDLDEFLNGCLGLHGPAKAIHLAALMYETRLNSKINHNHVEHMYTLMTRIAQAIKLKDVDDLHSSDNHLPDVSRRRSFTRSADEPNLASLLDRQAKSPTSASDDDLPTKSNSNLDVSPKAKRGESPWTPELIDSPPASEATSPRLSPKAAKGKASDTWVSALPGMPQDPGSPKSF